MITMRHCGIGAGASYVVYTNPVDSRTTKDANVAEGYLTACEHSCQAEPGDGKPVPQEMGEEDDADAAWLNRNLVNIINLLGVKLGKKTLDRLDRVQDTIASLQQQVAGLTADLGHWARISGEWNCEREALTARATAAEAERDRLREICELLKTWWDREDAGSGIDRDKEGGERLWWAWWKENCRLCDEVKTKLDAALSPAETTETVITEGGAK
jgi:hypothetical protein